MQNTKPVDWSRVTFTVSVNGVAIPVQGATEDELTIVSGKPMTDDEWRFVAESTAPPGMVYVPRRAKAT